MYIKTNKDKKPIVFSNTYISELDKKNNLILPTSWRPSFTNIIFVTKGYDGCLELRNIDLFNEYSQKLSSLPNDDVANRILKRNFIGSSFSLSLDGNGKFTIPLDILKEVHITNQVNFVGNGSFIEIWDADIYEAWKSNNNLITTPF